MDATGTIGTSGNSEARDRLMGDLKMVIRDAEDLLKNTGQQTGEGFKAAKAKFETTLHTAKTEMSKLEESLVTKTKDAVRATDEYVTGHPWQAVGISACVGVICGMLIARR